ncbi:MAG TPA: MBL fold metallo-hydrolase [Planctomycetota bacterium]|nr:MBL fold metallo-hydrolase [Planctomycetota bacterium]
MKITFHGAARSVTGSRHLVEARGKRILLDCGLVQGPRRLAAERNRSFGFDLESVDAVVLSHAHIDHSGALPALVKRGFRGPVFATPATADLADVMLQDSAFIQEKDVEIVNRREGGALQPLYTVDDAKAAARLFRPVPYGKAVEIFPGVQLDFHDAGHMLGSSLVRLRADQRTLVFSGDLGRAALPILRSPEHLSGADAVIVESTYGDRTHPPEEDEERELEAIVNRVVRRKGKIIIPAFAVGRTQHLTWRLKKLQGRIPPVPVFVDSPLAADVTDVYRRHPDCHEPGTWTDGDPFGFGMLRYTRAAADSKRLNALDGPAIIIAASGMCETGRILHHLEHHGPFERNMILFVGYQAEGTLGRRILDGQRLIRVYGREVSLRAEVAKMDGLSAHADRPGLEAFIQAHARTLKHAFVVHGEPAASDALAGWIRRATMARTAVPALGETAEV